MNAPQFVFGYGSLVAEHERGHVATLRGHRRVWGVAMDNRRDLPGYKSYRLRADGSRPQIFVAFLDIAPDDSAAVAGICMPLADGELRELDDRERNYDRVDVTDAVDGARGRVWAYRGSQAGQARLREGLDERPRRRQPRVPRRRARSARAVRAARGTGDETLARRGGAGRPRPRSASRSRSADARRGQKRPAWHLLPRICGKTRHASGTGRRAPGGRTSDCAGAAIGLRSVCVHIVLIATWAFSGATSWTSPAVAIHEKEPGMTVDTAGWRRASRRTLVVTVLTATVAAAIAASAPAAVPVPVGTGAPQDVAVDAAGTAHVVWNVDTPAVATVYCQVVRGTVGPASGCRNPAAFPAAAGTSIGDPLVLLPGDGRVLVLRNRCCAVPPSPVGVLTSNDGGVSFLPEQSLTDGGLSPVGMVDAVYGPGNSASWVDGGLSFQNAPLGGPPVATSAELFPGPVASGGAVGLDGAIPIMVAQDGAGALSVRSYVAGDLNSAPSWGAAVPIATAGTADHAPRIASGPRPAMLVYRDGGGASVGIFARSATGGGPAPVLVTPSGDSFDAFQDGAGRLHVVWGRAGFPQIFWRFSADGGVTWSSVVTIRDSGDTTLGALRGAAAPDGQGWVAYRKLSGAVELVPLAPASVAVPPPPPAAPAISSLRVSPSTFRAARSGASVGSASSARRGRVTYSLNIAARVRFTVERATSGRRVGGRCLAATRARRSLPSCTRWVRVPGSFSRNRAAGADRFNFTGRMSGRRLSPASYRLVATPTAGAVTGAAARARFRIRR